MMPKSNRLAGFLAIVISSVVANTTKAGNATSSNTEPITRCTWIVSPVRRTMPIRHSCASSPK